jgi:polyferredoxin
LVTVIVTVLFGRLFCGYACPVGTILDWFSSLSNIFKIKQEKFKKLKALPLAILAVVLVVSIFASSLIMSLDPISLLTRTFAAGNELFNMAYFQVTDVVAPIIKDQFGSNGSGFHGGGAGAGSASDAYTPRPLESTSWILGLFAFVVALNLLGKRFWCRYLCPLGGLLGLLGRVPLFRRKVDETACIGCQKCAKVCSMDAVTGKGIATDPANCTLCLECRDECSENAISWGLKPNLVDEMPSRRAAITVIGGSIVAAAAIPVTGYAKDPSGSNLLRPPGVSNEELFLQKCIRCGECISKCPTKALQPSLLQYGAGALWTPHIDYEKGVCDFYCNLCGAACPTGAIEFLMLEKKQRFVMGIAEIDTARCYRYIGGFTCGLCARECPVPGGAIETGTSYDNFGIGGNSTKLSSGMPLRVREEKCIGCGVCEAICPVEGKKAIKIMRRRVGETALITEKEDRRPSVYD